MSRIHGKDASLFSDIANTTLANELESRMKELERNIAVAHQFIKLADESYNQVKHEWDLLQRDIRPTKTGKDASPYSTIPEIEETPFRDSPQTAEKSLPHDEPAKKASIGKATKVENHPERGKDVFSLKKEAEPSEETIPSFTRSKPFHGKRPRAKGENSKPKA